jgi:hypoxanthine-DNA glycosylase
MISSFQPIVDKNSKILILGTMPGETSLQLQQCYGHKGNKFWKLIFAMIG